MHSSNESRVYSEDTRDDHEYYDRPYYLGADGDPKTYFALAEALADKDREGFARWVMRKKEYIGALRSRDGYLLLITLRHTEEVLTAREIGSPAGRTPDVREIKMAEQLVSVLEGEFRAEDVTFDSHLASPFGITGSCCKRRLLCG